MITMLNRIAPYVGVFWCLLLTSYLSAPGVDFPVVMCATAVTAALLIGGAIVYSKEGRAPLYPLALATATAIALAGLIDIYLNGQSYDNPLFRLRIELSECALRTYAVNTLSAMTTDKTVGLFHFERIERLPKEVVFTSGMCGVMDQCGLVYRTTAPPRVSGKHKLTPLHEEWYILYDVF